MLRQSNKIGQLETSTWPTFDSVLNKINNPNRIRPLIRHIVVGLVIGFGSQILNSNTKIKFYF